MQVTETTRVLRLIRRFSAAEELFGWYGIETEDIKRDDAVRDIAWAHRADVDDLIADLQAIVDDESRVVERDPDEEDDEFDEDGNTEETDQWGDSDDSDDSGADSDDSDSDDDEDEDDDEDDDDDDEDGW